MQHGSFIIGDVYKQKSHAFFLGIVRHFDQRQGVDGLSNLMKVHKTSMFHPKKSIFEISMHTICNLYRGIFFLINLVSSLDVERYSGCLRKKLVLQIVEMKMCKM